MNACASGPGTCVPSSSTAISRVACSVIFGRSPSTSLVDMVRSASQVLVPSPTCSVATPRRTWLLCMRA